MTAESQRANKKGRSRIFVWWIYLTAAAGLWAFVSPWLTSVVASLMNDAADQMGQPSLLAWGVTLLLLTMMIILEISTYASAALLIVCIAMSPVLMFLGDLLAPASDQTSDNAGGAGSQG